MTAEKIPVIRVGDILILKKRHPCGTDNFRVMRVGSDVRIVCVGCGRDLTMPREKLERAAKRIIPGDENDEGSRSNAAKS